jgi:uncharacterized protein (TIGR01777 family)
MRWVAEHRGFEAGRQFRDLQIEGPFAHWEHTHSFEPDGPDACLLEDHIEYALPGGRLGRLLGGSMVRDRLARLFDYRHQTTASDLAAHRRSASTMRIGVSGASGLLGSALVPFLTTGGHEVQRIARRKDWDFDLDGLGGLDAVVHLAGENLAMGRWTAAKKERIRASRVEGTRRIAEHVAGLRRMPRALVVASAVGFYGDRGDELLEEESPGGEGFLAEVCRDWEAATRPAEQAGVRVVHLRSGVILSPAGGGLAKMLPPFRLGLGGRLGSGEQYMSWISVDDAVASVLHALQCPELSGPLNVVAPGPVTNLETTKTLGRVLRRPTVLPMPAPAARLIFGEMADALLLASQRVSCVRLEASGFRFRDPGLEGALRRLLGRREG